MFKQIMLYVGLTMVVPYVNAEGGQSKVSSVMGLFHGMVARHLSVLMAAHLMNNDRVTEVLNSLSPKGIPLAVFLQKNLELTIRHVTKMAHSQDKHYTYGQDLYPFVTMSQELVQAGLFEQIEEGAKEELLKGFCYGTGGYVISFLAEKAAECILSVDFKVKYPLLSLLITVDASILFGMLLESSLYSNSIFKKFFDTPSQEDQHMFQAGGDFYWGLQGLRDIYKG
jgi:hypothetical protein